MNQASLYVSIASLAVACIAMLISFANIRKDLPRPQVRVFWERFPDESQEKTLEVEVTARGGGSFSVKRIFFNVDPRITFRLVSIKKEHLRRGSQLPAQVSGRGHTTVCFAPEHALRDHLKFLEAHGERPARFLDRLRYRITFRWANRVGMELGDGRYKSKFLSTPMLKEVSRTYRQGIASPRSADSYWTPEI